MASKATVQRREVLREAVESLALATVAKNLLPCRSDSERTRLDTAYEEAVAAFDAAADAFVEPLVRLVDGGLAGQEAVDEEFKCQQCGQTKRCSPVCESWHATIRAKRAEVVEESFPICTVCDQEDDPSILCCEKGCPRRDRGETA